MGKKYIIELEDNQMAYATTILDGMPYIKLLQTQPYTAPDLEKVRKKAYDNGYDDCRAEIDLGEVKNDAFDDGYKCGIADAWEAARTIVNISWEDKNKIFDKMILLSNIFSDNTASEAIAKIKKWEEKQEELHVGDVVTFKTAHGEDTGIVVECHVPDVYPDVDKYIVWCGGKVEYIVKKGLTKTGTHFPEVADLLKKMKEE